MAHGLGLEERPQIGGLDIGADRFGLRALAQHFRKGQEQREHGDHERDFLVRVRRVFGVLGMLHLLVCFRHDFFAPLPVIPGPSEARSPNP